MLIAHPAFVPGVLTGIFFVVLYVGFLIEASRGDDDSAQVQERLDYFVAGEADDWGKFK